MKKVITLCCLLVVTLSFGQQKPNIIVVLADDLGVGDVSYYRRMHSDNIIVETPAIDKLSQEGMVFTDAHSPAALCAPSRYAIMTGNHCYRSYAPRGVWGSYERSPIEKDDLTLGRLLKRADYNTAFFGKWHLGGDYYKKGSNEIYRGPRWKPELDVDLNQIIDGPQQNGFDYSVTMPAGIQDVPYAVFENGKLMTLHKDSEVTFITNKKMAKLNVKLDKSEGLGDSHWNPHNMGPVLTDKAVDYIKSNSKSKQPFFMYYSALAVHKPHTPASNYNNEKIAGTTPSKHLDLVKEFDIQINAIIQTLKSEGIYDNTLIIVTSDNGGLLIPGTISSGHSSNDIYRNGKNSAYEGGHRVPFIVSWPGKIKPNGICNTPVLGIDIMATLAAITNQELGENEALDSANLLPTILGETKKEVHPFLLTQSGTKNEVMITQKGWKLIIKEPGKKDLIQKRIPIALFNLNENPEEKETLNLISNPAYKSKVATLFNTYTATRESKVATRN